LRMPSARWLTLLNPASTGDTGPSLGTPRSSRVLHDPRLARLPLRQMSWFETPLGT
jgi:hypothetical protein